MNTFIRMALKYLTALLLTTICMSVAIYASNTAGAFMEKALDARSAGMGLSQVAFVNDSRATYWNPAGLAYLESNDIQLMETTAYETNYISAQAAASLLGLNWGVSYIGARVDGILETTLNSSLTRYIETGNVLGYDAGSVSIGTGLEILPSFAVGLAGTLIQEKAGGFQATGTGLNVSCLYTPIQHVTFGVNAKNLISPKMEWNTPSKNIDTVSSTLVAGVAVRALDDTLVSVADVNTKGSQQWLNIGVEYWMVPQLALRAGRNDKDAAYGIGLLIDNLRVDVALTIPDTERLSNIYRFSVGYQFKDDDQ